MNRGSLSALLFAGCAAVLGCGSDGGDKSPNTGGSTDGGGSKLDGGSQCDRSRIPAYQSYPGALVWTEADRDACEQRCPQLDDACLSKNCPGVEEYTACINDEINVCLTSTNGPCRSEWETSLCCALQFCNDEQLTDPQVEACLDKSCKSESGAYQACGDRAIGDGSTPSPCVDQAVGACLLSNDAGVGADAGTSGGADGSVPKGRHQLALPSRAFERALVRPLVPALRRSLR